ncbi:MAG TPA: hypothetical protein VMU57_19630 [Edaphobacter sp.]|uniref:hypothetical protein n=1 Tax=Edaphobacter sp. TaxID=1934404 RepID=UPI002BBE768E|nr:hypothetical protein [Edaphobacter sp.]HUZ97120.1 hypothetical protein [Edaphobacter sp.]
MIAVLPLILNGCSCGHDFSFHLLNWMEAARQFTHGNLHPHWAFSPAYNAGEPRFVFYPPLSWTIGAILGFLMPWAWTPIAYTWLALTAAGLALYRLAREFSTPNAALIAAAFYLVNPYTLFTTYERTAYAELLAAAWIPLLLLGILCKRVTIPGIAIPVALLWLTNDPAAVMGCYALALLTLVRLLLPGANPGTRTRLAATTTAGTLLGLGLAALYILPAAYERRYVQIAMILAPGTRVQNNFLFHHTISPIHDAVLNTASIIAVVLLVLTTIAVTAATRSPIPTSKDRVPKKLIYNLTILAIAIAFLLTSPSNSIWQHVPELPFLQFPWRLLAILAAVLSLTIALALTPLKLKTLPAAALSLAVAATLTLTAFHLFHQYCYPEDTVPASLAVFRSNTGTEPSKEYTPTTASNTSLSQTNPPYWLIPSHSSINTNAPANTTPGTAPASLTLNSPTPQTLVLNLRDYPAWRITLNQAVLTSHLHRSDGLIAIPIPAGLNHITVTYGRTLDQTIGDILTLLSLILLLLILRHKPYPVA